MLDTPTKATIIGAAAILVLAAGLYIANEYSEYSGAASLRAASEATRNELFSMAKAEDGEIEKVRSLCLGAESLAKQQPTNGDYLRIARNCRALGYL